VTAEAVQDLTTRERRRLISLGLIRALVATVVLVALYYLLPLDHLNGVPVGLCLTVGLLSLVAVSTYQVRAIITAPRPAVRAVEALATTAPLYLLLFAASYFLVAQSGVNNFSVHALTRTDSLYFTVTVFSTVGFGDITATSQSARLLVTVQMIINLFVLGLGIRVFIGAVKLGRQQVHPPGETSS
jgi:voltage-gated potassium channel